MNIVRFKPEHLTRLELQGEQQWMRDLLNRADYGPALALGGPAFTAMQGDTVLGCGGSDRQGDRQIRHMLPTVYGCQALSRCMVLVC